MSALPSSVPATASTRLLDKYMLPKVALPVFLLAALIDLRRFGGWGVGWLAWPEVALLVGIGLAAGWFAYGRPASDPFGRRRLARLALGLLLLDALVQAAFDVTLAQGRRALPLGVHWLHVAAFGLWFGATVWNIFIAAPEARGMVSIPVVVASSQQLDRFLGVGTFEGSLQPLGQAFQEARIAIRDLDPADPTWLMYTLCGNPNCRAVLGDNE